MLLFPNAKINLGLRILRKRSDGYHDISTIMLPIGWCDILEILPAKTSEFQQTGLTLDCPPEKNIILKALRKLEEYTNRTLPPLHITLEKHTPFGAGLGGGSADAAFALIGVNAICKLGLSRQQLATIAAQVGADCPFFIYNQAMLAEGIGEKLTPADVSVLQGLGLLVAKPHTQAVNTATAYAGVTPTPLPSGKTLTDILSEPISSWQQSDLLVNDFENSIFPLCPEIADVKNRILNAGAIYSAMSGSGAAAFGIFESVKMAELAAKQFADCAVFAGEALYTPPQTNVLL